MELFYNGVAPRHGSIPRDPLLILWTQTPLVLPDYISGVCCCDALSLVDQGDSLNHLPQNGGWTPTRRESLRSAAHRVGAGLW